MSGAGRPAAIDRLREIADRFDHLLIDQYGVLHDGRRVFPGVIECLERLRAAGKRTLVLSNSGRRAAANAARLAALGLAPALYDGIVTSGEATWRGLRARTPPPFDRLGRRCCAITRGGDRSILDGLDIALVDGPDEADFLLLAGLDDAAADPALWRKRLAGAAARGVPLICANPDVAMFGATGLLPGPGAVAAAYAEIGGPVHLIGKPEGLIYACCLAELGLPDPGRVLAVGDSLDHDVLGGNRAGLL
ncbi:MAG: TIGR01459 family HAD-type hydrolase, partial [Rhodospirillaceae bacterium]|nr:TIGR01459 family HAD-type hydrolase [Rhodospirillaceae bacterium]